MVFLHPKAIWIQQMHNMESEYGRNHQVLPQKKKGKNKAAVTKFQIQFWEKGWKGKIKSIDYVIRKTGCKHTGDNCLSLVLLLLLTWWKYFHYANHAREPYHPSALKELFCINDAMIGFDLSSTTMYQSLFVISTSEISLYEFYIQWITNPCQLVTKIA